jgi:hypothetical protein
MIDLGLTALSVDEDLLGLVVGVDDFDFLDGPAVFYRNHFVMSSAPCCR